MNRRIIFLTSILIFTICLILFGQNESYAADIEITGFNEPVVGLNPQFSATVTNNPNYTVDLEAWWGNDGKMIESVDNPSISDKIDVFEKGVSYTYEIYIKPTQGSTLTGSETAEIDGQTLNLSREISTGGTIKALIYELNYGTAKELPIVSNIEISNVTMPIAGQKPTLTGKVPDGVNYKIYQEFWYDDETQKEITTEFEEGKSYTYYCLVNAINGSTFAPNVKATINGKDMKFESNEGQLLVFSYTYKVESSETLNNNATTGEDVTDGKDKDKTPKTGNYTNNNALAIYLISIGLLSAALVTKKLRKSK